MHYVDRDSRTLHTTVDFARYLDQRFIRWAPMLDTDGNMTRDPATAEWLKPAHEAMKREAKGPAQRWLFEALQWRPTTTTEPYCDCCPDIIDHLAMIDRTTPPNVFRGIVRATLRVRDVIGTRGGLTHAS